MRPHPFVIERILDGPVADAREASSATEDALVDGAYRRIRRHTATRIRPVTASTECPIWR